MIHTLTLVNFQRHRNLSLTFTPGVNTIVGRTEAGKSTALRALRWLALGGASTTYVSHGEEECGAWADTGNGTVVRKRGKAVNSYWLDAERYDAVGVSVPEAIRQALDLTDLNFQGQFDRHFLISESPGEVGRVLNSVVGLERVDPAVTAADAGVRAAAKDETRAIAAEEQARGEVAALEWVEKAAADLAVIEQLEDGVTQDRATANRAIYALRQLEKEQRAVRCATELAGKAGEIKGLAETLLTDCRRLDTARALLADAEGLGADAARAAPDMTEIIALTDGLRGDTQKVFAMRAALARIEEQEKVLCRLKKELGALRPLVQKALTGKCPLCGRT